MTTAKDAGLVIGKQYAMKPDNSEGYPAGTIVTFAEDDETNCPKFTVPTGLDSSGWNYIFVSDIDTTPVDAKPTTAFSVQVRNGTTTFEFSKELTTAQVTAVLELVNN